MICQAARENCNAFSLDSSAIGGTPRFVLSCSNHQSKHCDPHLRSSKPSPLYFYVDRAVIPVIGTCIQYTEVQLLLDSSSASSHLTYLRNYMVSGRPKYDLTECLGFEYSVQRVSLVMRLIIPAHEDATYIVFGEPLETPDRRHMVI